MNVVKLLGETCLHTLMKVVKRNLKSLPKYQKLLKTYAQVIARSMGDASIALVFATTDLQQMTARYRSIKYQAFQCKLLTRLFELTYLVVYKFQERIIVFNEVQKCCPRQNC